MTSPNISKRNLTPDTVIVVISEGYLVTNFMKGSVQFLYYGVDQSKARENKK
jgi:hypothetical protein